MHEMPMTTAPMRPTVPALRPFFESAVGSEPARRRASPLSGAWAFWCSSRVSFCGSRARHHDHRHGQFMQHLRSGRAEEQAAGLREPARADDGDLAGSQLEVRDGVLDAVAAADDRLGVDVAGQVASRA